MLALGAWNGYRKGLINTLGGMVGYIISLVLALMYSEAFAGYLDAKFHLVQKISGWVTGFIPVPATGGVPAGPLTPQQVDGALEGIALPAFMKAQLAESLQDAAASGNGALENLAAAVGDRLASMLVEGLAFLILLFAVVFVARLLTRFITGQIHRTILGRLNRVGGLLCGLAINTLILAMLVGVIAPFFTVATSSGAGSSFGEAINQSVLVPYLLQVFALVGSYVFGLI